MTLLHTLKAVHLQKHYGARTAVRDGSFEIRSGEILGWLCPNGAGKTTSFYMLVGLIMPDAGHIFYDHHDISAWPVHKRAKSGLGYLPQEPSIFRKLTVEENILAILELRKDLSTLDRKEQLSELLHAFHIAHLRHALGISLSGGERRRVEIARALAGNPAFILLDEPFAGIDPLSIIDLKNILKQLREKNIGILITDHNVRETLTICQRAYIVSEGKILCGGSTQTILADRRVREIYLGNDFEL